MTRFEADGVYNNIPYRVLPDCSIEAMTPSGVARFKDIDQLVASSESGFANTNGTQLKANEQGVNVSASTRPLDYYSILVEAIEATKQNSAQLRALIYERARFNLKRDVLFGYSSMGLADVVRQINEFELAVARIEANAVDDPLIPAYRERDGLPEDVNARANNPVQILPPQPAPPLYADPVEPFQRRKIAQHARLFEELAQHARSSNKFVAIAVLGMAMVGVAIITMLWPSHNASSKIEIANKVPQTVKTPVSSEDATASTDNTLKAPFPLPSSFGIYVLSDNKLTELEPLPVNIPDPRIALSAEIDKPSTATISDNRPAFILFRRDLLNSAPQKIMLRVIARMAQETKIVDGKAKTTKIEGAWRIRNISRELKISPIPGQREMVIARVDDDVVLDAGRYALVLNRTGYDFTVTGAAQSSVFCLEKFETTNGSVFNQCRAP